MPYIITSVHVVMYFTLSTAPHWCAVIGQMDLNELLWLIIEMFDDKDDWTRKTLAWWNVNVTANSDDDISAIHAQHVHKTKHLSMLKCCAAEAIEFGTPPPPEAPEPEARPSTSFTAFSTISRQKSPDLTPCPLDEENELPIVKMANTILFGATLIVHL
ncbi:hypothetical protein EDC04DRAFT_2606562 [Pisolithus marmoratus]|nr:hypothetical protein EDC04DRAFT_2606562 [Pisolithus marmoratus]